MSDKKPSTAARIAACFEQVCKCDDAALMNAGMKNRPTPGCPIHRPDVPHGAALALNSAALAANVARALGGTVTNTNKENN